MICDMCGTDNGIIRTVTRSYGSGKDLLVIEGIPVVSCSSCGESYFLAETLHEIERIKIHKDGLAHNQTVPVAVFA